MSRPKELTELVDKLSDLKLGFVIAYEQNGIVVIEHSDDVAALGVAEVARKTVSQAITRHAEVNEGA